MEPAKPFACSMPDCGMTFTNVDHLNVHVKKHDMMLQLGMGLAGYVADQTPTPTRFIRNCEEVGLFQDLHVNPFDEGFKRAMDTKQCMLTLEGPSSSEDVLHTPHLVFPRESGDCTVYTSNNQRNITISRSSSDESGAVKEYETTKISKLTNEVTTISRVVGKDDLSIVKHEETTTNKDILNETSVSYTNNVIIHSNVEIRQDINIDTKKVSNNTDSIIKDSINMDDLVKFNENNKLKDVPPIMSQRSLDFVVDSLTTEPVNREESLPKNLKRNFNSNDKLHEKDGSKPSSKRNIDDKNNVSSEKDKNLTKTSSNDDYEVIIKLPNGKHVRMKAVDDVENPISVKEKLNRELRNKIQNSKTSVSSPIIQNIVPITTGTLIPVTIVNPSMTVLQKIPIQPLSNMVKNYKSVKRKSLNETCKNIAKEKCKETDMNVNVKLIETDANVNIRDSHIRAERDSKTDTKKNSNADLKSLAAASKRYRERLKLTMHKQAEENRRLREVNQRLAQEKALLQVFITDHLQNCPNGEELTRTLKEKLQSLNNTY